MITQFQLSFESVIEEKPVTLSSVTGSQLHGLWFSSLLPAVTSEETTWLHEHPSPKPFSLAPITEKTGRLTGLRVATFQERAAALFQAAAVQAKASGDAIRLGNHQIEITALRQDKPVSFMELLQLEPRRSLTLHFLTPTAFKRGPRRLHLPLPANVFDRPAAVWRLYAPPSIQLPSDWLMWCEANIYAQMHHIHTAQQAVNARGKFTGFVGAVKFAAVADDEVYLRLWQSLGRLASYCGVGSKTTMGMGAVAWHRRAEKSSGKR